MDREEPKRNAYKTEGYLPTLYQGNTATLLILEGNNVNAVALNRKIQWSFGRVTPINNPDIGVSSPIASRTHGKFVQMEGHWYYVNNPRDVNTTFYNGKKILSGLNGRKNPVELTNGDVLRIDYENLLTPDPRGVLMLFIESVYPQKWKYYSLPSGQDLVIGRDPKQCGIVCDFPYVSAKHAKIAYINNNYYLSDCSSHNGTWLNGKKIERSEILQEKDRFSLCNIHFIFTRNNLFLIQPDRPAPTSCFASTSAKEKQNSPPPVRPVLVSVDIRSKCVRNNSGHGEKKLLQNIQFTIGLGTLTAIIGTSGAGKSTVMSTVMNCLNGVDIRGLKGSILLQGEDLVKNFNRLKPLVGSIPKFSSITQENVIHMEFTPEQEFYNAAKLRLPGDTTRREIKKRVDETIRILQLEAVRRSRNSKLSGGEQKRVHIGIELVADRQLLCLDEPEAGQDSAFKRELFKILLNLAHEQNKSIVTITHDTSSLSIVDQIIMLTKVDDVGRLAFAGTPTEAEKYFGCSMAEAYQLLTKNPQKYIRS